MKQKRTNIYGTAHSTAVAYCEGGQDLVAENQRGSNR